MMLKIKICYNSNSLSLCIVGYSCDSQRDKYWFISTAVSENNYVADIGRHGRGAALCNRESLWWA